jgi:hypothetical protein
MLRRSITTRDFVTALTRDDGRRVVVAYHGLGQTFPIGTLRAMVADIGWKEVDLARLGLDR